MPLESRWLQQMHSNAACFTTPREADLGLRWVANSSGIAIGLLPNGSVFAIEHGEGDRRIMINQVLGSPLHWGIGRLVLCVHGGELRTIQLNGPDADLEVGIGDDRIVWAGVTGGIRHRTTLWLDPKRPVWLWRVEVEADGPMTCDVILVQDLGLASRNFLMNNEAYGSQYTDHHVVQDDDLGPVVMSRQNLGQGGRHPWIAHGCLEGAVSFATDGVQIFGPGFREGAVLDPENLPGTRLQHEAACVALQSRPFSLDQNVEGRCTFFAVFDPDHAAASSDADLARVREARHAEAEMARDDIAPSPPARSLIQGALPLAAHDLTAEEVAARYPERHHEEMRDGVLLSFFTGEGAGSRHVATRAKDHLVPRRHGTLLRTGQAMLPDEATACVTAWMHGVFAAQLTIGNTSFHKLFSVSRDPYNITRASGLRMLAEIDGAWRLLATPSMFEMGLSDARWVYRAGTRTILVHAVASGEEPVIQWRVSVEGAACRFLVFGHVVLGEREYEHAGQVEVDAAGKRVVMRPDPDSLFGQHYPDASYLLVTATPDEIEAIGGDELLQAGDAQRTGTHIALRTRSATEFSFAITGSLTEGDEAERLADKYAGGVDVDAMLAPAKAFWHRVTRDLRLEAPSRAPELAAIDTAFPWFAHDAVIHLTVPHGLEQYTGAAWGTRDVCQGPIEFLLSLRHDTSSREILRIVFAEQYETRGDWPQWFMLPPYSHIRDHHAHGDVIVWPLKALCDYVEETNDFSILDEQVAWRHDSDFSTTEHRATVAVHVERLIETAQARFIPGTHLICYGEGDWNDSLQPADPSLRDCMVSTWTCTLLWQQLRRYAELLRRAGRGGADLLAELAEATRADIQRYLIRDGVIAGYGIFGDRDMPELLLHPTDTRTGLRYSLLPMTRGIISGLFTPEQAADHLALIREHLLYPDGAHLMDRPVAYKGGVETIFRRAESASFFGREIGLMYSHAHLRYAEALAKLGEGDALWEALSAINPVSVAEALPNASQRQRNAFFSSSDAAFPDRYAASAEWERLRSGDIGVEGGWRIYSSGPGLYANVLIRHALGRRRFYGEEINAPVLPQALRGLKIVGQ